MRTRIGAPVIFAMAVLMGRVAQAETVIFTWNGSSVGNAALAGTVTFSTTCPSANVCNLLIDIQNRGAKVTNTNEFLTGLFFDITQDTVGPSGGIAVGQLTMASATAMDGFLGTPRNGSDICGAAGGKYSKTSCSSTVSGGWEASYSSSGWTGMPEHFGLGTVAYSKFGSPFNGGSVGSYDYSILPQAGSTITNRGPDVIYEADFVLSGLSYSQIYVSDVKVTYGTSPNFSVSMNTVTGESPEPGTSAMILLGLALLLFTASPLAGQRPFACLVPALRILLHRPVRALRNE